MIFKTTGVHDMAAQLSHPDLLSIPDTIVRNAYIAHQLGVRCGMVAVQLAAMKLVLAFSCAPLIILFYFVGTVDGLAQRAIRKANAGQESATMYHRAKYLQMGTLTLTIASYVVLPFQWNLPLLFALVAFGIGVLARVQWTYYKKHI